MFRRFSLTSKMLMLTAVVGLVVWAASDTIQTRSLEKIFHTKLAERLSRRAEDQRIMFDRYVKGHHQAVTLLAETQSLRNYIGRRGWRKQETIKYYKKPPPWLPRLAVIRNFVQPRYLLLLDGQGRAKEIYQSESKPLPAALLKPTTMLLRLSRNQGFLTRLDGEPYLIATEHVTNGQGRTRGILMLVAPLDEQFLTASQGSILTDSNVIALLTEDKHVILVSSNAAVIPKGIRLSELKNRYLVTGQGFFDYGATDIVIVLVSFTSNEEVRQMTYAVLAEDRFIRGLTAFAFVGAFVLIMFLFTRRLQRLTDHVKGLFRSMNLKQPELKKGDQISMLEERFNCLAEAVQIETAALEHQALHDPLTELPNRKLLNNRLQQEILRNKRSNKPCTLIISDLNHFKEVNDTLGHHIGDLVLQQAADRLGHVFRQTDSIARLGGDEFGILLPETNLEQAAKLSMKVVDAFQQPFVVDGHRLSVGISLGIAECPTHGTDSNILVQRADVAMYFAKRNKLGYAVYDPDNDTHSIGRLALMSDFRNALNNHMLELFYQPKACMTTGRIIGVEALLRWNHPERGYIGPSEFIPLAEQTGQLKLLTAWVLEKALHDCIRWTEAGFDLSVAVNLSVQNLHDATLQDQIAKLMKQLGLPSCHLILEITESGIMTDPARALETLAHLNRMGITLSIDDFGTGYSSLSYLRKLPVEEIKIDRSFVMDMLENENDEVIVKATVELAHNLGLKVVAEGVKNREIWKFLESMGCDIAQGHFISEPMPAECVIEWLSSQDWPAKNMLQAIK